MWYRLSRREDDYCIECSQDGATFRQMRICHLHQGGGKIRFGIYACSPEDSSFTASFSWANAPGEHTTGRPRMRNNKNGDAFKIVTVLLISGMFDNPGNCV